MPTKTFFNLPAEKREKLLRAIRDEYARVPVDEVSINKIVHAAEIPRGSFYQYFSDKQDMLAYLLSDYKRMVLDRAVESLRAHGGDLFAMFRDIVDFTVAFVAEEQANAFCKNIFADIRLNAKAYPPLMREEAIDGILALLRPHINVSALDIRHEDDLANMLAVLMPITGRAIAEAFMDMPKYTETRGRYHRRLLLLQRGFMKNKEAMEHNA